MDLKKIVSLFEIDDTITPYGNGHINDTYLSDSKRYILQRMNTGIFKNPDKLMENIVAVTEHLRKKIEKRGGDPDRETLRVMKAKDGNNFVRVDGECYRMYRFVENAVSYETAENEQILESAAYAFGRFQNMMDDFPADELFETIADFHNTPKRLENFKKSIKENKAGRLEEAKPEIEFALARENIVSTVTDAIASGEVPLRVTHNDTKLNNVLFDGDTNEAICVIDLDTVMPGSLLYDYGDALRFAGSTGAEDEEDLDKIHFDLNKFKAFTIGFVRALGNKITEKEAELLPFSIKLMTYECGIRFLGDFLDGDTYFKVSKKNHNLYRARTQFKLISEMEEKMDEMNRFVSEILKK